VNYIASEAADLARMASAAYVQMVAYYRGAEDADALARTPFQRLGDTPSHEVGWFGLNTLMEAHPEQAIAIWERVKVDAAGYVAQGYHVADALDFGSPWKRAQFAVIRRAFEDEWQPRGGVEGALLDTIAHAYLSYLHWAAQVQQRGSIEPGKRGSAGWELPLQTTADALDQAAQMMDRFNRIAVRSLRALRDLRRYSGPGVIIGGQVNIAANGGQQVNVQGGNNE